MFNEIEFKIALGRIEKFLTSRGYSVKYDSNSYYIEESTVHAPRQYRDKHNTKLLCALLHEAGHTITPDSILFNTPRSKKRDCMIVLEQEYLAWMEGLNIARALRITTPELTNLYLKEWTRNWWSYIKHHHHVNFSILVEPYITQFKGTQQLIQGEKKKKPRV
jgi:hypothetical protein